MRECRMQRGMHYSACFHAERVLASLREARARLKPGAQGSAALELLLDAGSIPQLLQRKRSIWSLHPSSLDN
ncbi:hypothetical protein FBU59_005961 [Linderina macrospora]|uniref:Uncharacterized protein n=1 Tax=Linderina macrospora TaxID=4868 RepID=A0ACC1J159_9FUNG|nr:hypothetical protein FBU59_005961 [Linderina macrospora]